MLAFTLQYYFEATAARSKPNRSRMCLQVRSNLQRALGRPVALGDVRSMTIAAIKALEGIEDAEESANGHHRGPAAEREAASNGVSQAIPIIYPAKLVDLARDFPSLMKPKRVIEPPSDANGFVSDAAPFKANANQHATGQGNLSALHAA